MAKLRSSSPSRALLALVLAAAWAAAGGCDEKEEIALEDQRLFLSAIPGQTCPAIVDVGGTFDIDPSAAVSNFELVATVFADDGQVQEGVEILIESSEAGPFAGETDERGQFRTEVLAPPRPPDFVQWTATAENGERSETETTTGFFPFMSLNPESSSSLACGEEFSVVVDLSLACLVSGLEADFTLVGEDPDGTAADTVEFLGAERLGRFEFDPDGDATNDGFSSLVVSGAGTSNGDFGVVYRRSNGDGYGATSDGGYVRLNFRALDSPCVEGSTAILVFRDQGDAIVEVAPAIGGGNPLSSYDLWNLPNDADVRVGPGVLWTIVEPPAP